MFMSITWHRNNFSHYFPTKIQAERNFHHHRKRLHRETHWREQDPGGEERRLNTNTDTEISYSNKQKDDLGCSLDPAQQDLFSQLLQKQVRRRLWLQEWCLFVFLFRAVVVRVTLAHFISQGESIWQNDRQASITVDHAAITHVHRASSSCMCRGTQEGM